MPREYNFRLGKGRIKERRKAISGKSVVSAMRFVGMTDEEIKKALKPTAPAAGRGEKVE